MADGRGSERVDTATKLIKAAPSTIYRAFLSPDAVLEWLPPAGMTGNILQFEPREGGAFRMTLTYDDPAHSTAGKTSEDSDVVEGRFATLVPDERIVQLFEFRSEDPAFAGTMTMTWSFVALPNGTEVTVRAENVPHGIQPEDHVTGMKSSLDNLATFTE